MIHDFESIRKVRTVIFAIAAAEAKTAFNNVTCDDEAILCFSQTLAEWLKLSPPNHILVAITLPWLYHHGGLESFSSDVDIVSVHDAEQNPELLMKCVSWMREKSILKESPKKTAFDITDSFCLSQQWWTRDSSIRKCLLVLDKMRTDTRKDEYVTVDGFRMMLTNNGVDEEVVERLFNDGRLVRLVARDGTQIVTLGKLWGVTRRMYATLSEMGEVCNMAAFPPPPDLNAEQKVAFMSVMKKKLTFVPAEAGTGKSHVCASVIRAFEIDGSLVVGPTHKSLDVLRERVKKVPTRTLASTRYALSKGHGVLPTLVHEKPRIIVLDEFSMLKWSQLLGLFNTFGGNRNVRFLVVGDPAQLPCIGGGDAISDLKFVFPHMTYPLVKNMRSAGTGNLEKLARVIHARGRVDVEKDVVEDEYLRIKNVAVRDDAHLVSLLGFSKDMDLNPASQKFIAVISYKNDDVRRVNWVAQDVMQRKAEDAYTRPGGKRGEVCYRGDPVMITSNTEHYKNGQTGVFKEFDSKKRARVKIVGGKTVTILSPYHFVPAYAMTVHKSQGSGYPRVVFLVGAGNLTTQLAYVAVTRAKQHLTLVGDCGRLRSLVPEKRKTLMQAVDMARQKHPL
tara:strand:+ start:1761 stop:3617 length:1857 start_codon:yes stop_codon:yes gene_type:complete